MLGGLQHELCGLLDTEHVARLEARLTERRRWPDVRRIHELWDPSTSHDWLWSLNPAYGAAVPPDEFATAVRVRLGAFLTDEPVLCPRCGESIVERTAAHGLCCAAPEGTHGHYQARDSLLSLVHLADPAAAVEVPELIADAPALRPADIFTTAALPGCQAALDIGICSPDAAGTGLDCCETMWRKKRGRYADHHDEMRRHGIVYVPVVVSCYGRMHPDTEVVIDRIAMQAARRFGVADHRPLLRRAKAALGVAIWRRAVAMTRACLPRISEESLRMLFGEEPDEEEGENGVTSGAAASAAGAAGASTGSAAAPSGAAGVTAAAAADAADAASATAGTARAAAAGATAGPGATGASVRDAVGADWAADDVGAAVAGASAVVGAADVAGFAGAADFGGV